MAARERGDERFFRIHCGLDSTAAPSQTWGEDEAGTVTPPSNSHWCARAVAVVGEDLARLARPLHGCGVFSHIAGAYRTPTPPSGLAPIQSAFERLRFLIDDDHFGDALGISFAQSRGPWP